MRVTVESVNTPLAVAFRLFGATQWRAFCPCAGLWVGEANNVVPAVTRMKAKQSLAQDTMGCLAVANSIYLMVLNGGLGGYDKSNSPTAGTASI